MEDQIITIENKKGAKLLRRKVADFDFKKFSKKEVGELILRMKRAMHTAGGIGLSANQIGLNIRTFVAEVPTSQNKTKFYAIFNPKIEKTSKETVKFEEGCLSVPLTYGQVERARKITLTGQDRNGKQIKIKAWGVLARIFQHEVDHLNGGLFTDKTKDIHRIMNKEF